jgi:hypothetical protein
MRRALLLHPDFQTSAVAAIEAVVVRERIGTLKLTYRLTGRTQDLALPANAPPARKDGLWQHTCFEAFLRPSGAASYYEFNFSPSTEWAAYRFGGYRDGVQSLDDAGAPEIVVRTDGTSLTLEATLALGFLPRGPWQMGLSAVIEDTGGRKSYWALAHPAGKPDFHHPDCFALELV